METNKAKLHRPKFTEVLISEFDNVQDQRAKTIRLFDFLKEVRQGNEMVEALRTEADEAKQKEIKKRLKTVCVSALFNEGGGHNIDNIKDRTGLICVDIDHKDNPGKDPQEIKRLISDLSQTLYCAYSSRGKGVFAIMRLLFPDCYKGHAIALRKTIFENTGLIVDPCVSNPVSLRYLSYDSEPYTNYEAEPFYVVEPTEYNPKAETSGVYSDEVSKVKAYIDIIVTQGIDIAPTYLEWRDVGFALHSLDMPEAKDYFRVISDQWERGRTTDKAIESFWRSVHKDDREGAITIATFYHQCHKYGIYLNNEVTPFEDIDLSDDDEDDEDL